MTVYICRNNMDCRDNKLKNLTWHDMTGITSGILWIWIIRQECQVMVWRFIVDQATATCYMAFTLCHWDEIAILTKYCLHWLYVSRQNDTVFAASDDILSAIKHLRFCGTYQNSSFVFYCILLWLGIGDFTHIIQGYFTDTGENHTTAQCLWSILDVYGLS